MQHTTVVEIFAEGSLGVPAAAREYGISRSTLYELMAEGRLAYSQFGRRRVIPRLALTRLLAEALVGTQANISGRDVPA